MKHDYCFNILDNILCWVQPHNLCLPSWEFSPWNALIALTGVPVQHGKGSTQLAVFAHCFLLHKQGIVYSTSTFYISPLKHPSPFTSCLENLIPGEIWLSVDAGGPVTVQQPFWKAPCERHHPGLHLEVRLEKSARYLSIQTRTKKLICLWFLSRLRNSRGKSVGCIVMFFFPLSWPQGPYGQHFETPVDGAGLCPRESNLSIDMTASRLIRGVTVQLAAREAGMSARVYGRPVPDTQNTSNTNEQLLSWQGITQLSAQKSLQLVN